MLFIKKTREMSDLHQQEAECVVCGNAAFDLLDGLYFCSECGTQSQVQVSFNISDASGT